MTGTERIRLIPKLKTNNFMKLTIVKLLSAAAPLILAACAVTPTPQERLLAYDKEIDRIIAGMSLEEKVEMLHGKSNMASEGIPRLGIQEIRYADGPFGIREENGAGFRPLGWTTDSATYFPTGSALAATWSEELSYKYGTGMGTEARRRGKDVILGPAINIQRLPVGGRTYEYFSEDPFLTARLAVGYVKGTQDAGTAVCVKHFAVNNQETNRAGVDVQIDERTLRELYLKPFEASVREGGAWSVMSAYNKLNGTYCAENEHLLNEILRGEWGFNGPVISDWGGTYSTVGSALHGQNVQMPGDNFFGQALIDSVKAGAVPESVIDRKVRELLRLRFTVEAIAPEDCNKEVASTPESRQTAYEVATKSIVLLKNDGGLLPIAKDVKKIAVIGRNAVALTQSGGVGAGVKSVYEVTPLQGIRNKAPEGVEISYAQAYKNYASLYGRAAGGADNAASLDEAPDPKLLAEAVAAAKAADLVIFVCGTSKTIESEGFDRSDIKLPVGQDEIVKALAEVNPDIVSVIISGGPCDLQELTKYSPAIVEGWWNGLEGGNALGDVLFGNIAPSGKLPFTFPIRLEDSPAYAMGNFPQKEDVGEDLFTSTFRKDISGGKNKWQQRKSPKAYYTEKMLVGYRWFDTKQKPVMFAFGHGLSYVDFEYGNISTDKRSYKPDGTIKVSFTLSNTGDMTADEVAQLYIRHLNAKVEYPYKELKAFSRVTLAAGETKIVTLEVPVSELRYWDEATNGWKLEEGEIELLLGSASDDIRLSTRVKI